jgi:hypothetical protein
MDEVLESVGHGVCKVLPEYEPYVRQILTTDIWLRYYHDSYGGMESLRGSE